MVIDIEFRSYSIVRGYGYSGILGYLLVMYLIQLMYLHRVYGGVLVIGGGLCGGLLVEDWVLGGEGDSGYGVSYLDLAVLGNTYYVEGGVLYEVNYAQEYKARINRFIDIDYGIIVRNYRDLGYSVISFNDRYILHFRSFLYWYIVRRMVIFLIGVRVGGLYGYSLMRRYLVLGRVYEVGSVIFYRYVEYLYSSIYDVILRSRLLLGDDLGGYGRNRVPYSHLYFKYGRLYWYKLRDGVVVYLGEVDVDIFYSFCNICCMRLRR